LSDEVPQQQERMKVIEDFYREERELMVQWDILRAKEKELPLVRAAFLAADANEILASIHEIEKTRSVWPPFLDLQARILLDIEELGNRLHDQMMVIEGDRSHSTA
jgi:hypothetical protein